MRSVLLALIVKTFLWPGVFAVEQNSNISSCFTTTTMCRHVSHRYDETTVLSFQGQNAQPASHVTTESRLQRQLNYCKWDRQMNNVWSEPWTHNGLIHRSSRCTKLIAVCQKRILNGTSEFIQFFTITESMWTKLLLLLIFRIFLKGHIATELQFLSLMFVQLKPSLATLAPSPSAVMTSSASSHVIKGHDSSGVNSVQSIGSEPRTQYYDRGECDLGWYQFGKFCYKPSAEVKVFDHAQRACEYRMANLVSITSKEENSFTVNISKDFLNFPRKSFVWIGMERREATNRLHWIDGSKIGYENWILGEPDSNGACVQMINKGLWEDNNCFEKIPFICKKRSSYTPPYSRSTELGILIGIPFSFALIVILVVGLLMFKSIRDSDDTFYGYGKNRNKEKMHAALVNLTASIAHVSTRSPPQPSPRKERSRPASRSHSLSSSHVNPAIDVSDIGSQSPLQTRKESENGHAQVKEERAQEDRDPEEIEMQVCVSSISIEKEHPQFELATSLDQLVNVKPKSRRLRGLKQPDATVRPPGNEEFYRKKTYV